MSLDWNQLSTNGGRILFFVIDGVGDIPDKNFKTPLTEAKTPYLDSISPKSSMGMHLPIDEGITPGSEMAHMALFGFDPLRNPVGRGVFEALGLGFNLSPGDLAVRGNLAFSENGKIIDRRAGRIGTSEASGILNKISKIQVEGCSVEVVQGKGHRFSVVFKGEGLNGPLPGNDSGETNVEPFFPSVESSLRRSRLVMSAWVEFANDLIKNEKKANCVLLRGADVLRPVTTLERKHLLTCKAVANYPCYIGVAKYLGMDAKKYPNDIDKRIEETINAKDDFVFFHYKDTDAAGEDGDFKRKTLCVEEADSIIRKIMDNSNFDVLVVTGDHCTPCSYKGHSWHRVPILIHGGKVQGDSLLRFNEIEAKKGSIGSIYAKDIMPLVLANASRLKTYLS
ncbi:phosphoglycerate mutase [bacterium]|nr:phosphoglycerate mutase [bacterium]|tara:strand:- start:21922 stop:23106 length:1185 start_codon:yes stop_codon:yes gene_type:complete